MSQIRASEMRSENSDKLGINSAGSTSYRATRRARWSRTGSELRIARVEELEKQLADSHVLDDDEEESPDARNSWRSDRSSVDGDQARDTSGFLMKKSGAFSGTKKRYFLLKEGTLLWYKSETDRSPTGYVHLKDCFAITEYSTGTVSPRARPTPEGTDANCGFTIKASKEYTLWADDESERDKWLRCLRHNSAFPPLPYLSSADGSEPTSARGRSSKDKDGASSPGAISSLTGAPREMQPTAPKTDAKAQKKSMLGNLALRAEKKMISRAVTSDLGKKLLREYCLPETFTLLQAMRDLASLDPAMPPKAGSKIEDTILRMAVKVVLLFQHGRVTARDFDVVVRLVDDLCIDIVRKFDCVTQPPHVDVLDSEHLNFGQMMRHLDNHLGALLDGHISPKNLGALSDVVSYLGTPANLKRFMEVDKCKAELGKIAESLRIMYGL